MVDLESVLATDPNVREISLEGRGLEELDSLLPILGKFPCLETLNLSENNLKALPADLSSLPRLRAININGNRFDSFAAVISALQTLPQLRNVSLNLQQNEEVELTLNSLPNLEVLNEQEINHEGSEGGEEANQDQEAPIEPNVEEPPVEAQPEPEPKAEAEAEDLITPPTNPEPDANNKESEELKLEDLEEVVKIYDAFRALSKRTEPGKDRQLEKEFEDRMSQMASELKTALESSPSTDMKNVSILKTRHEVLDITFGKMVDSVQGDKAAADIWRSIRTEHNAIVNGLLSTLSRLKPAEKTDVHTEVAQAQKETREVLEAAQHLEGEMQKHVQEKESMRRQFENEKKELQAQVASLEEENKKYLDTIIKRSKVIGVATPNILGKDSPSKGDNLSKEGKKLKALPTGVVGPTQVRTLTLKQLKDLIQDMYVQKQKFDEKCAESKLPRETMEQYMYSYLNQRYGLKNLIIEWAAAIINGIKRYSLEDSDVALFGKILRNECDEDFRFVHNEVKSAMADILKERIRRKYKHKTEGEFGELMTAVQNGNIEEWQWKEIIRKMYNEEHFSILEQRIRDKISERNPDLNRAERKRLTREELMALQNQKERPIPFVDFQKIVLDFQLATHEKYIRKFVSMFKKLDADTNGILNEEEFNQLVAMMRVAANEEEVNRLLQVVDPYNNQQITFSECLALLSSENVAVEVKDETGQMATRTMSLLEKFVTEEAEESLGKVPEVPSPAQ